MMVIHTCCDQKRRLELRLQKFKMIEMLHILNIDGSDYLFIQH
jgi:hypothetical protein